MTLVQRVTGSYRLLLPSGTGSVLGENQHLTAIVQGHKQSQIDDLLPWNYTAKV